jgi:integrase
VGRIYQRKPGGTWHGYWTDLRGQPRRQSLRTRDQQVARAKLRKLELGSADPATHSHHTLRDAIGNMLAVVAVERAAATATAYAQKGHHLTRLLGGDTEVGAITRDAVMRYIATRQSETAANGTIHKELVVLRRALAEARTRNLWSGSIEAIVPKVRVVYHPKEVWLDEHQAESFLTKVAARRRLWVMLAMWGGLSLGEVERIRWEHVDFGRAKMRVPGTKRTSRWRVVPITPQLLEALRAGAPKRLLGPIVTRWRNVRRDLARAAELAKVPKVTPNDLRRTFASWLKNQKTDSAVVARLLGHTSTKMVDLVYGRLSEDTLAEAVSRLPGGKPCAAGVQDTRGSRDTNETVDAPAATETRRKSAKR